MRAIIVLHSLSGFGDVYSNIYTGYQVYLDLLNFGYEVELLWHYNNVHYPAHLGMDHIFDQTLFKCNINYTRDVGTYTCNLTLLPQNQNSILIYVDTISEDLKNYQFETYDHNGFHRNSYNLLSLKKLPCFNDQFLSKEVLEISKRFIPSETKFKCIHIRTSDETINSPFEMAIFDPFFSAKLKEIEEFIEKNSESKILICSINKSVKEFFLKKYTNTFSNHFTYDIDFHYSYASEMKKYSDDIYITHIKEIVAEMSVLSKCDKIFSICKHLSNFLTYGIAHNQFHKNWENKLKNLMIY